jgi:hypothetical protein
VAFTPDGWPVAFISVTRASAQNHSTTELLVQALDARSERSMVFDQRFARSGLPMAPASPIFGT